MFGILFISQSSGLAYRISFTERKLADFVQGDQGPPGDRGFDGMDGDLVSVNHSYIIAFCGH